MSDDGPFCDAPEDIETPATPMCRYRECAHAPTLFGFCFRHYIKELQERHREGRPVMLLVPRQDHKGRPLTCGKRNCKNPVHARGLCDKHYQAAYVVTPEGKERFRTYKRAYNLWAYTRAALRKQGRTEEADAMVFIRPMGYGVKPRKNVKPREKGKKT